MDSSITKRSSECYFLKALFDQLRLKKFRYCVLRNFAPLPETLGGSDLDLLVFPEDRKIITDLVAEVAAQFGGQVIAKYSTTGTYLKLLGHHKGQWWGAAVDLLAGVDYRGMVYVSSEGIMGRTEDYRGIKVATAADVETMALLKEMINNSCDRKDYFWNAVNAYNEFGDCSLEIFKEAFSEELIKDFRSMLIGNAVSEIPEMSLRLRREIWSKYGLRDVGKVIANNLSRYRRLFKTPGVCLAVTGTDGAGKTTIINAIKPVLENAMHSKIQYEHLRPNWLKALGVVSGKRESKPGEVVNNPHGQEPSGKCSSVLRVCYYWLDYTLGFYLRIYLKIVRKAHICIFDRYYYDVIIDPRRMRISLPQWMLKTMFIFAPKPHLLLCLGADPEIIYEPKPETSPEEVRRQVTELKKLCSSLPHAVWVDTGISVQDSVDNTLKAIQAAMASRYSC